MHAKFKILCIALCRATTCHVGSGSEATLEWSRLQWRHGPCDCLCERHAKSCPAVMRFCVSIFFIARALTNDTRSVSLSIPHVLRCGCKKIKMRLSLRYTRCAVKGMHRSIRIFNVAKSGGYSRRVSCAFRRIFFMNLLIEAETGS